MTDELLRDLARRAGISVEWQDNTGKVRSVEPPTLRSLLAALGLPAMTGRDLSNSRREFNRRNRVADLPPLVTGVAGRPTRLDVSSVEPTAAELLMEGGEVRPLTLAPARGRLRVPPILEPGYHRLAIEDRQIVLAIAPPRCRTVEDAVPDARLWGIVAGSSPLTTLRHYGSSLPLIEVFGPRGADALAISFNTLERRPNGLSLNYGSTADVGSRLFPDPAIATPSLIFDQLETSSGEHAAFNLRALFDSFLDGPDWNGFHGAEFARFRAARGSSLEDHARFIALRDALGNGASSSWRAWPLDLQDPRSAAVEAFAAANRDTILFHQFTQWLADRSKAAVHQAAMQSGMRIGLITQLPLGVAEGGSEVWTDQGSMLLNLTIASPPSELKSADTASGQTGFSPRAMERGGYAAFIGLLRAAMRYTGGIHIPGATGLARQWLVPAGASAEDGAFVNYPATDLVRLIALESARHRAIVTADVGSDAPRDFTELLEQSAVHTTRALVSSDDPATQPAPQGAWTADTIGLTSNPSGPSIRQWWQSASEANARSFWDLMGAQNSNGSVPGSDAGHSVVEAALAYAARSDAPLVLVPLHDVMEASSPSAAVDPTHAAEQLTVLASLRPRY